MSTAIALSANIGKALTYLQRAGERSCGLACEIGHFGTLAIALMYASAQHLEPGEAETAAGELADALVRVSEEHGHEGFIVAGRFLQSWVRMEQSHSEDGIAGMRNTFNQIARINLMRDMFVGRMAECPGRAGQTENGLKLVDEALATAGYRCEEADWHRIKGDLLLRHYGESAAEAEKCFRKAIELARLRMRNHLNSARRAVSRGCSPSRAVATKRV